MTLTLKIATQFDCMTLHLKIIHHHTKCGHKRLDSSVSSGQKLDVQTDGLTNRQMDRSILGHSESIITPSTSL